MSKNNSLWFSALFSSKGQSSTPTSLQVVGVKERNLFETHSAFKYELSEMCLFLSGAGLFFPGRHILQELRSWLLVSNISPEADVQEFGVRPLLLLENVSGIAPLYSRFTTNISGSNGVGLPLRELTSSSQVPNAVDVLPTSVL